MDCFPDHPNDDEEDDEGAGLDAERRKYTPIKDLKDLKRAEEWQVTIAWRKRREASVRKALAKLDAEITKAKVGSQVGDEEDTKARLLEQDDVETIDDIEIQDQSRDSKVASLASNDSPS